MTTITCFDCHLGWKFHCKACHFARVLGFDRVLAPPFQPPEEGTIQEDLRRLFFGLIIMDVLFRLFYDKPAALKYQSKHLESPYIFPPPSNTPAGPTIVYMIWTRIMIIESEFFEYVGDNDVEQLRQSESFKQKVNSLCCQLEGLLDDWPVVCIYYFSSLSASLLTSHNP